MLLYTSNALGFFSEGNTVLFKRLNMNDAKSGQQANSCYVTHRYIYYTVYILSMLCYQPESQPPVWASGPRSPVENSLSNWPSLNKKLLI